MFAQTQGIYRALGVGDNDVPPKVVQSAHPEAGHQGGHYMEGIMYLLLSFPVSLKD